MNWTMQTTAQLTILTTPHPTFKEHLAATELQRGLYQLGYANRMAIGELPGPATTAHELRFVLIAGRATAEDYDISTRQGDDGATTVTIAGAGEQALLYGVFEFLERQGAFFGLDGDLYPLDRPHTLHLPEQDQPWRGRPRFATRGLMPWPDFLNCLSVFNREDFRAYLEAMLRMRFNTLGIHVYGQRDKWAESFLSVEYGGVGYTAYTDTTATDRWGYLPQRTSRYGMGAAQYFDGEVFGSDATRRAHNIWEAAELAQALWREAFSYAEKLGIRTGVGFEPYQVPDEILRACPPEVRLERIYHTSNEQEVRLTRLDPESRAARDILEARLGQLLEAYPSVSYVYLWEDEWMTWVSRHEGTELPVTPFKQAYDFLRRHAPDKRLVLAGWGGFARHFETLHRALPEDVILTCLSDSFGWDPIHKTFGQLESRERWPVLWLEDDPSMWFPQLHVHRFARDMALAEQYDCQGILGLHWRHRIVDPNAGYLARRSWEAQYTPADLYHAYARTQATSERASDLARLLDEADAHHRLLSTWTGEWQPDGHIATQAFAGDYSEGYTVEAGPDISDDRIATQAEVITQLGHLLAEAASPLERERLGYLHGQMRFLEPYARAWQVGRALHRLLTEQRARKQRGESAEAAAYVREHGVPLWITLLRHVREAVLAFQCTVATRNDQGMLASLHNKFVRITTFRMRSSLLEFLDELPPEAEAARAAALAPDTALEAAVFVPTRPTRLSPGEQVTITAVAPGAREPGGMVLRWRRLGTTSWQRHPMRHIGRRTYAADFVMPLDVEIGVEYYVEATFAGAPSGLTVTAPPAGPWQGYLITT